MVTELPAGAACLVSGEWIGTWDATLDATGAAFSGSVSAHLDLLSPSKTTVQLSGQINFATGTTAILNNLPITADPTTESACNTVTNGLVGDPKNPRLTFSATITPSGLTMNGTFTYGTPATFHGHFQIGQVRASRSAVATVSYPGLDVSASGTPAQGGLGTIAVSIASTNTFRCPNDPVVKRPVATVTAAGFVRTDRITVQATLPRTSPTDPEVACLNSPSAFLSTEHPTIAKAGTFHMLGCAKVKGVPPCVLSSVGPVVTFVIPGRDPRFYIVLPKGRQIWVSHAGTGKVGKPYSTQLQTSGGLAPIAWTVTSGTLPNGCTLNRDTGAIHGRPTKKGSYTPVIKATDGEKPPKTATISLPIKIT
jgi:hypothetical protein